MISGVLVLFNGWAIGLVVDLSINRLIQEVGVHAAAECTVQHNEAKLDLNSLQLS